MNPLYYDGFGSVGEYGITALVPQIRLRDPLFEGRLTPYFVAGAGVALGEFNDRKAGTFGKSVDADRTMPVGTVGAGIEYFIADIVAVGVEVKYRFAGSQDVRIDGEFNRAPRLRLLPRRRRARVARAFVLSETGWISTPGRTARGSATSASSSGSWRTRATRGSCTATSALVQRNRAAVALAALLAHDGWHGRLLWGSDYPLPGVMPLTALPRRVTASTGGSCP